MCAAYKRCRRTWQILIFHTIFVNWILIFANKPLIVACIASTLLDGIYPDFPSLSALADFHHTTTNAFSHANHSKLQTFHSLHVDTSSMRNFKGWKSFLFAEQRWENFIVYPFNVLELIFIEFSNFLIFKIFLCVCINDLHS